MKELVSFLTQRLDEDAHGRAELDGAPERAGVTTHPLLVTRLAAELDAKRRILDLHGRSHKCPAERRQLVGAESRQVTSDFADWDEPCPTLKAIATAYQDHPDFRDHWR
jgi:hypothetical protein